MPTPSDVWTAALAYEGVPWRHQGRRKEGVDCLGLLVMVAIDLGMVGAARFLDHQSRAYGRLPPNRLAREILNVGCVRAPAPALGCIGLFAQLGSYPSHVGLFGECEMIHALAPAGKVIRHGYVEPWPSQLRGVFRYPGID